MPKLASVSKTNAFASAQVVAAPASGGKAKPKEVQIAGLATVAAFKKLGDTIQTLHDTARISVDAQVREYFVTEGAVKGTKPANIRGVDGNASGSCQANKRTVTSALTPEQCEVLDAYKISYDTVQDRPETFIFNQDRLPWVIENAATISKSLEKIPGYSGDLIQKQVATTKHVVSEETLTQVFALKDEEKLRLLVPLVTTVSVKPTTTDDIAACLSVVINTLCADREQARLALTQALRTMAAAA